MLIFAGFVRRATNFVRIVAKTSQVQNKVRGQTERRRSPALRLRLGLARRWLGKGGCAPGRPERGHTRGPQLPGARAPASPRSCDLAARIAIAAAAARRTPSEESRASGSGPGARPARSPGRCISSSPMRWCFCLISGVSTVLQPLMQVQSQWLELESS
uniref:probable low affinity copper uptake protein 2 isoform X1 n=1 Tax=Halichoerus grypus TaxID=9711 RepID=UPI00165987AB|nr:probable low affinity copper uptake protein 2 isoform X1 [Halichoerus grypus]